MPVFGVETIELDLPALAGAFGRRLHDAGVPVDARARRAVCRALTLARPVARRRLYWTARAVFVSDLPQVRASTPCSPRCSAPAPPMTATR